MSEFRLQGVPSDIAHEGAWIGEAAIGEHRPLLDPGTGEPLDPQKPHHIIQESHALMGGLRALAGSSQALHVDIVHFDGRDPRSLGPDFEGQLAGAHYLAVEGPGWNNDAAKAQFIAGARGNHTVPAYNRLYQAAGAHRRVPIIADWKRETEYASQAEVALAAMHDALYGVADKTSESYRTHQRLNIVYTGLREWTMLARLGYGIAMREGAQRAIDGSDNSALPKKALRSTETVNVLLATDPLHADLRRKLDTLGISNAVVDHTAGHDLDLMTAQLPEMLRQGKLIPERYADDADRYQRYTHHYSPREA